MPRKHNAQLFRNVLLHSFDCVVFEFHDLAASLANEMVVMVLSSDFVTRLVLIEMTFSQQLAFFQQFERAIDRRVADVRIYFLDLNVKFFGADMPTEAKKNAGDVIAGRCRLQAAVAQTRMEQLHPLLLLAPAGVFAHCAVGIKFGHGCHQMRSPEPRKDCHFAPEGSLGVPSVGHQPACDAFSNRS
jgi:hypothetical protein